MVDDDNISSLSRQTSFVDFQQEARRHRRRPSELSHKSFKSQSSRQDSNENTTLLEVGELFPRRNYNSNPGTPRLRLSRYQSSLSPLTARTSRTASFTQRLTNALSSYDLKNKRDEPFLEDRVWYDQVSYFILSPNEHWLIMVFFSLPQPVCNSSTADGNKCSHI